MKIDFAKVFDFGVRDTKKLTELFFENRSLDKIILLHKLVQQMQSIATYNEKKGFAQRTYSLQDAKIEISGKRTPRGDFETEIALKDLRLPKDVIYRVGDLARAAAVFPGLILLIVILIFGEKIFSYSKIIFWIALAASVAGMILGSIKAKKFKFYLYNNESGMPAFDISEHGNKRENFESFGDLIDQQIKKSKKA